ncbi:MAG: prephenate/arogenate dehydrogenase family protein [Pseudomonadota bacterium]
MASPFRFERVAIVGIGLIGASIALALRQFGFGGPVAIADCSADALRDAKELQLGTSYSLSAADAVSGADLVILCVPVGAVGAIGEAIAPALKPGAIVTDVGSVKGAVIEALTRTLPAANPIVPGHPISGSEHSGPHAGFATLFRNRWCVLTPAEGTDPRAVDTVEDMWRGFEANVERMDAGRHDMVLAITSHLPQLISYNIVRTASDMETVAETEVIKFSAGGFRDFTRLAASDPTMWRDVFLHNKEAVLETLGRFSEDLAMLQRAIRWGHGEELFDTFTRTRAIRREVIAAGQDTAAPNFGRPAQTGLDEDDPADEATANEARGEAAE